MDAHSALSRRLSYALACDTVRRSNITKKGNFMCRDSNMHLSNQKTDSLTIAPQKFPCKQIKTWQFSYSRLSSYWLGVKQSESVRVVKSQWVTNRQALHQLLDFASCSDWSLDLWLCTPNTINKILVIMGRTLYGDLGFTFARGLDDITLHSWKISV